MKDGKDNRLLTDALLELPVKVDVGDRSFDIYPKTLGMVLLLERITPELGLEEENLRTVPTAELLRVCQSKKDTVSKIIAMAFMHGREVVDNHTLLKETISFISTRLSVDDMASLLLYILTNDNETLEQLKKDNGIDIDIRRKEAVGRIKEAKNSIAFGGNTIYGTLINFHAEKFHRSLNEILWGVSYVNLMMSYLDYQDSIYLTDDERKRLPAWAFNQEIINPYDKEKFREYIESQDWS